MLNRHIVTATGETLHIKTADPRICSHFEASANYADVILKQINEERIYDDVLFGRTELTILDLGANIGLFSLYAATAARLLVAVEPTPNHFYVLNQLTKSIPNIYAINAAAAQEDGVIDFFLNDDNTTMNSLVNQTGKRIGVRGMTIPSLMRAARASRLDLCKLDIEGSEVVVLSDKALEELDGLVDCWFVEIHNSPGRSREDNVQLFLQLFAKHGYRVERRNFETVVASRKTFETTVSAGRYQA